MALSVGAACTQELASGVSGEGGGGGALATTTTATASSTDASSGPTGAGGGPPCANGLGCPCGEVVCGDACVDTTSDATSCGGCGHACAVGEACAASACVSITSIAVGEEVTTAPSRASAA